MDNKLKKAVADMAKEKESGYNFFFSQSYNQIYRCLQKYTDVEHEILELMHGIYIEIYRKSAEAEEREDVLLWASEIANRKGQEFLKQSSKEEKADEKKEIIPRLPVKKAQQVYDACCALLGLKPTPIEEGEKKVIVSRKVKEKVKETVIDEAGGMVKDEIKGGIKALLATLSTKAKVALLAGAVTTTAVTTGVVGTVISSKEEAPTVVESREEVEDLSSRLGVFSSTMDGYEGEKLLEPEKTGEYEYTFALDRIREHFEDWEYMAIVIDDLPEGMALAYYLSAIDEEGSEWIPGFTDSNVFPVGCSGEVKVYIVPEELLQEYRSHMYDD